MAPGAGAEPAVSRLAAAGRSSDPTEVDQQAPLHCMSCASARSKRGFEMLSRALVAIGTGSSF